MKLAFVIVVGLSEAVLVQTSQGLPCVDASDRNAYNAKPISRYDVLARNAIGKDRQSLRISTTCIHIDRTAAVSLLSLNHCIAKGDYVTTVMIGGQVEVCRVSSVVLGEDYAQAKYK